MLMDSNALSTDLLVGLMLGHRSQYHRLECELAPPPGHTFAIDEVKSMGYLAALAWEIDFDNTVAFVKVKRNLRCTEWGSSGSSSSEARAVH
jgi:hypothetical protein